MKAHAQYIEREGGATPDQGHVELVPDGSRHRSGVWIANQKQRRDRLDPGLPTALAQLGIEWAR
ncbi:hypothetical protein [Streptomyces sp. NPDC054865]